MSRKPETIKELLDELKLVFWMKGKEMRKFHAFKEDSGVSLCKNWFVGFAKDNLEELYDENPKLRCRECMSVIKKRRVEIQNCMDDIQKSGDVANE